MEERERWSIDFANAPLSDVLRELTNMTGVNIITESTLGNRLFTKSYKNQTIEEILKDIFRNVNHASVWQYKENHLDSISIRIFDASEVGPKGSSHAERVQQRDHNIHKPFGNRRYRDREATPDSASVDSRSCERSPWRAGEAASGGVASARDRREREGLGVIWDSEHKSALVEAAQRGERMEPDDLKEWMADLDERISKSGLPW